MLLPSLRRKTRRLDRGSPASRNHTTLSDMNQTAGCRTLVRQLCYQRIMRATCEVCAALELHGITAVVLKGAVLAERLYGAPTDRPTSVDVDILVAGRHAGPAGQALAAIGYCMELDGLTRAANKRLEYNTTYLRAGWPAVEVHFRLTDLPGAGLGSDAFVARRRPYQTRSGKRVWVLEPEDEFLFLCAHGVRHHFERPMWLTDLERFVLTYPELRWDTVVERAGQTGLCTTLWVAAQTLRHTLGLELAGGLELNPNRIMRRAWPHIVPAFPSAECHRKLRWGICDAAYQAALCDRGAAALLYLAKRGVRFLGREAIRRLRRTLGCAKESPPRLTAPEAAPDLR